MTRASSSCSPLRTSSPASVSAWRRTRRAAGAAPGAGVRSSAVAIRRPATRVWLRKTLSRVSPDPVSSATVPETATRPASRMNTSSARASASSMAWVVSTRVTPAVRSSRSRSQVARRACGSMPAVGSSRNTSSGRPTIAAARLTACCCPPDSRRYGVRIDVGQVQSLDQRRDVVRGGVEAGQVAQQLAGPDPGPGAGALRHQADPGGQPGGARPVGRGPRRRRGPAGPVRCSSAAGWSCPRRSGPGPRSAPRYGRAG